MEKQFVTYEIALKLKELGFDEDCLKWWSWYYSPYFGGTEKQETARLIGYDNKHHELSNEFPRRYCLAPLWQQAIDWLETKGYFINATRVYQWSPLPVKFVGWCIYIGTNNPEEGLECNSYYVNHFYESKYIAYNEAILKAIELIKNKIKVG